MNKQDQPKVLDRILNILETLRMYVNADGGDIEFVSYENKVLTLKILGACVGCPFITTTFDDGVKNVFLNEFPEDILDVKFI